MSGYADLVVPEPAPAEDAHSAVRIARLMGLLEPGEEPTLRALNGGVSSRIVRVDARRGTFCLKQALAKLRVAADWSAPRERNSAEQAWLKAAGSFAPHNVPQVLASAPGEFAFAMSFFEPGQYRVWKQDLLEGHIDNHIATLLGRVLGLIHQGTANRDEIARQFANEASFNALRLEPYLDWTARSHPDLESQLGWVRLQIEAAKFCLIHGDVSPKNILVSKDNIVLVDAECACYGDPAFDVAFCLNHLLLKAFHRPASAARLHAAFNALFAAYRPYVRWEREQSLEERTALILPALLLARVDGKSPVEYLSHDARDAVRAAAVALVRQGPTRLDDIWNGVRLP